MTLRFDSAGRPSSLMMRAAASTRASETSAEVMVAMMPYWRYTSDMPAEPERSLYASGAFAPVQQEVTLSALPIRGRIPGHLDGRYLRIGPNPVTDPGPDYHWFLGDGMVHGLRLRDGKAEWYRNRFVRSPKVAADLGEEPIRGARPHAGMDFSPNTNIVGHAGRTLALVEGGPRPYELTDELDTVGPCDFDTTLLGGYTAHPIIDPDSGELHAVSYFFGWGDRVRYTITGTDGRVRKSVDIKVHGSPMMHSFALTQKYVILFDLPAVFSIPTVLGRIPRGIQPFARMALNSFIGRHPIPERLAAAMLASGGSSDNVGSRTSDLPYRWDDSYPARLGLISRDGDANQVRWFPVDPCYIFHPLNAFDQGETVVLDAVRHPRMFATAINGPGEGDSSLVRWTLNLVDGRVDQHQLDGRSQEFPSIDERRVGRNYRYGYSIHYADREHSDGILRYDFTAGAETAHMLAPGQTAGEFTFVPSSAGSAEDDGILMGFIHDAATDTSRLQLLDAGTLEEVASVQLPVRVPAGFHGNWIPT